MATTSPARIDDDLYASAKLVGEVQSRSASQQVVHWARIGREIEASTVTSYKEIAGVLAGSRSYDTLSPRDQAIVRAEWATRMDARRRDLNLAREFGAAGRSWVELDDDGNVVEREATSIDGVAAGAVAEKQPSRKRGAPDAAKGSKKAGAGKVVTKKAASGKVVKETGTTAARSAASKKGTGSSRAARVSSAR